MKHEKQQESREVRTFDAFEFRVDKQESGPPKIIGHAAVFDQLSQDLGCFREKISKGAFAEAIHQDDVRALFNHNPDYVLGRNRSGTLKLSEDDRGLLVEITPPDTQFARDLVVSIERGDISQMSFGFRVEDQTWEEKEGGDVIRTINKCSLFDVSPVTYPAYVQTDVAVRSMNAWKGDSEAAATDWEIEQMRLKHQLLETEADL